MQLKIKSQEDFWAGIMFIGFGLVAIVVARDYPMGTAMRMGPGYFPTYLGVIMMVMGAIISIRSLWVKGEGIRRFGWRGLFFLSLAFATYGFLIDTSHAWPSIVPQDTTPYSPAPAYACRNRV
ncbi:MAG: tripartite tricarboxylate transporter TctB family protein, partial [Betaproteobacteria bacterium]